MTSRPAFLAAILLMLTGCVSPGTQVADSPTEGVPEFLVLARTESAWSDPGAVAIQASGPDGRPLLGEDTMPRDPAAWLTAPYRVLQFTASWSGGVTGIVFGYQVDGGAVTWLEPARNGVPQRVEVPDGQHEKHGGPTRWTFYWEPSTEQAPGTGGWAGPGSLMREVAATLR